MGIINDLIFRLSGSSGDIYKFFDRRKGLRGTSDLQAIMAYVATYKEPATEYGYDKEMDNRCRYFAGSMQADMKEILKRQFPNTHLDYEREMANLRVVRHIIKERAQAFPDSTRFVLIDRKTGDEADPGELTEQGTPTPAAKQAKEFQEMIEAGLWHVVSRNADAMTQLCHRGALKMWWDDDIGDVRLSFFPPQDVLIVRNPYRPWSPYSAPAVMFRHSGQQGASMSDIWEVFSTGEYNKEEGDAVDENGRPIWHPTSHYMTNGDREWSINILDENPFRHPLKKNAPFVPFTWFSDDAGSALYPLGDEDLLTINRAVNWGTTSLHINIIQQAFGIPFFRVAEGSSAKIPKEMIISPKRANALPPGVTIEFASPNLDISGPQQFYEKLMQLEAVFSQIDSESVALQGVSDESGRAILLKQMKLNKHLDPLRRVYKWPMEDAMTKGIIVRNYYANRVTGRAPIDLNRWKPTVVFGEVALPVDRKTDGETFQIEIENDISSPIDWIMRMYSLSKEEAQKKLDANRLLNEEMRTARRVFPEDDDNVIDVDFTSHTDKPKALPPGKPADEPEQKPAPVPPPAKQAPDAQPAPAEPATDDDTEGGFAEGIELAKMNIYQLMRLYDDDIISAVELRMAVYDETEEQALAALKAASKINLEVTKASAERKKLEAETEGAAAGGGDEGE